MTDMVTVRWDPPVKVWGDSEKAYLVSSAKAAEWLPKAAVTLDSSETYDVIEMPKWLADERGFEYEEHATVDEFATSAPLAFTGGLTRYDLLQAAAAHAMISNGMSHRDVRWESEKFAAMMTENDK